MDLRDELSWWGWGRTDAAVGDAELAALAELLRATLALQPAPPRSAPAATAIDLRRPRLAPPPAFAPIADADAWMRAAHTHGRSFRDVVRNLAGQLRHPPDAVLRPRTETEVAAVLDWAGSAGVAVVPFGGGTSVVGGIEADVGDGDRPAVSLDLRRLDRVIEVDERSRAARIEAGVLGPALERQLGERGLTLRHFPQSFEFSTLGGWLATRSAGHYATLHTHIDDFVESLRMLTPRGVLESRRLPASGAGPSPDRMMLGSEGILGVITEAWVRVQDPPVHRASRTVRFGSFDAGAAAVRALAQSGLHPANCRLLDPPEAMLSQTGDGRHALLLVAFESADHPVDAHLARALELCRDHAGDADAASATPGVGAAGDTAARWRASFLRAPYLRDAIVRLGLIIETFETAITWDRFAGFHQAVAGATRRAVDELCGAGVVATRLTHAYPDGCAPYYTVLAQSRPGDQLAQWEAVKAAAAEAILANGGTITHHHAVGRDHRSWYARQRPALFDEALRAVKTALDPGAILNPGVLVGTPGNAAGAKPGA